MGAVIDECKIWELATWVPTLVALLWFITVWVRPASLKFNAGWEFRLRQAVTVVFLVLLGLVKAHNRFYHARFLVSIIFGVQSCTPGQIAEIRYTARFILSFGFLPLLDWLYRLCWRPVPSTFGSLVALLWFLQFLLVGLPMAILYFCVWFFVSVLLMPMFWVLSAICVLLVNFVLPPIATAFALYLFVSCTGLKGTYISPSLKLTITEFVRLMRTTATVSHMLNVIGAVMTIWPKFTYRDRWYRRNALHSGLGKAVRATLPGLIGPVFCDQEDVSDEVDALRALKNIWRDLTEKEKYLDDKDILIYALSYRHMPDDRQVRLSETRATHILHSAKKMAKCHGYYKFMLWCDDASSVGVRTDLTWLDIGFLPYALFRTLRVESSVDGERVTSNRLWLEVEKLISSMTSGMDVINETLAGPVSNYEFADAIRGRGHQPMEAMFRVASKITRGDLASCVASREGDLDLVAAWARRFLTRSGEREMNEPLGWVGQTENDKNAASLLIRVSTTNWQRSFMQSEAEVAQVMILKQPVASSPQFWLTLLGFSEKELDYLTHEPLQSISANFEDKHSGKWTLHVVNLQGDFFANMDLFVPPGSSDAQCDEKDKQEGWLLTNSQVRKGENMGEWLYSMTIEMFRARGLQKERDDVHNVRLQSSSCNPQKERGVQNVQLESSTCKAPRAPAYNRTWSFKIDRSNGLKIEYINEK